MGYRLSLCQKWGIIQNPPIGIVSNYGTFLGPKFGMAKNNRDNCKIDLIIKVPNDILIFSQCL